MYTCIYVSVAPCLLPPKNFFPGLSCRHRRTGENHFHTKINIFAVEVPTWTLNRVETDTKVNQGMFLKAVKRL